MEFMAIEVLEGRPHTNRSIGQSFSRNDIIVLCIPGPDRRLERTNASKSTLCSSKPQTQNPAVVYDGVSAQDIQTFHKIKTP